MATRGSGSGARARRGASDRKRTISAPAAWRDPIALRSIVAACLALTAACSSDNDPSPLDIQTLSLTNPVVNQAYSGTVEAGGGSGASYIWTLVAGDLPAGLALVGGTPDATIEGTPTAVGTETFTLQVEDSLGAQAIQELSLTVDLTAPLTVSTATLPIATKGEAYGSSVSATGGTGPYAWSLASGNLPAGLALASGSPDATIAGTPTGTGTSSFTLRVQDSLGLSDTQALSLTVADLANALLLHWKLDETLGPVAVDDSGNQRDGELVNAPARVPGRFANGLDFDGTDTAVDGGTSLSKILPLSVAFWMNPRSDFSTQDVLRKGICEEGSSLGPPSGWGVRMEASGRLAFVLERNGTAIGPLTTSIPAIRNAWQHVVFTLRSVGGRAELSFYRDGAFVQKLTSGFTFNGFTNSERAFALLAGAGPLGINAYDGLLDDVRVYGRVLATPEVSALFASVPAATNDSTSPSTPASLAAAGLSGSSVQLDWSASADNVAVAGYRVFRDGNERSFAPGTVFLDTGLAPSTTHGYEVEAVDPFDNASARSPLVQGTTLAASPAALPDLVASWKLDESFGDTALDASGHGHDGELSGGAGHVAGRFGNGLDFDGSSGVMDAGAAQELSRILPLSVAFWIRPRDVISTQDIVRKGVAEFASPLGPPAGWAVRLSAPGLLSLVLDDGTSFPGILLTNAPLVQNVLQHVVLTLRSSNGVAEVSYYRNGNLVEILTSPFPFTEFTRNDAVLPLLVGAGPAGLNAFEGVLDEIRIVERVLTGAEVQDIFNGLK